MKWVGEEKYFPTAPFENRAMASSFKHTDEWPDHFICTAEVQNEKAKSKKQWDWKKSGIQW